MLENEVECLMIPQAVYDEVVIKGRGKPGAVEVENAKWILHKEVFNKELVKVLNVILSIGECEAIVLAKETEADLIILDDEKAREIAEAEGLKVAGLISFVIRAKQKGKLKEVRPIIDKLQQKGFFISKELHKYALKNVGE